MTTNPKNKQREYSRQYRLRNQERYRKRKRDMARKLRKEQPERTNNNIKRYRVKNPQKYKVQMALNQKVRSGKIKKSPYCEHCLQVFIGLHAHHFDYNKPFDVYWVCPPCHKELHKIAKACPIKVKGE